jgi:hypothetical protein
MSGFGQARFALDVDLPCPKPAHLKRKKLKKKMRSQKPAKKTHFCAKAKSEKIGDTPKNVGKKSRPTPERNNFIELPRQVAKRLSSILHEA